MPERSSALARRSIAAGSSETGTATSVAFCRFARAPSASDAHERRCAAPPTARVRSARPRLERRSAPSPLAPAPGPPRGLPRRRPRRRRTRRRASAPRGTSSRRTRSAARSSSRRASSQRVTSTPDADERRPPSTARGLDVGKAARAATMCSGIAVEPQRQLGDHAERPLRADEETRQVVAGRRLRGAAAGADHACRRRARPRARAPARACRRSARSSSRSRSSPPCRRASRPRRGRPGTGARAGRPPRSAARASPPARRRRQVLRLHARRSGSSA